MQTLLKVSLGALLVTAGAWAVSGQPLPTDPALTIGQLDNGLTYVVRQHANPPGRAVIWIHMYTGSLNETDRQRGLAHYLEHMAFNGSENFPPGSLVPFFQSLGMTFGRDQNAFTSFEQTTYQLSLPDAKPETLRKGMTYFADVLYRLSLLPKEIDEERQIIQEERRRSLSGRQRTMYYVLERIAPGSLYGQRITIGTEETINSVQQADFRDYTGKWYRASNATVIVVADADPVEVVAAIKEQFGGAPQQPKPTPQDAGVKTYDKSFAIVASDPEVQSESIRITRMEPARPPTTTVPQYRADLVARIAQFAFNRRIEAKVAAGGTAYLSGNASLGNEAGILYSAELSGQPAPGKWRTALEELALELQRARAFGFSPREIEDAKKQILSNAERAVETEATRLASAFMSRINGAVTAQEPILSAQQDLDLINQLLPGITNEEVGQRFATEFDPRAVAFTAVLPASGSVPTEAELLEAGTQDLAVTPQPEAETARPTQLMSELPKPGTVAESAEHTASGVWSAWLSNNVRVHHRFMDTQKNEVTVSIALLGGELLENAGSRGVTQAAQLGWGRPATQHLSSSDIRELMTGKKVSVRGGGGMGGGGRRGGRGGGGGGGADAVTLTVSGSPDDLEVGLQLAYLLLTEPKVESAAFTQFQTQTRQRLEEAERNPSMLGARLAGGAPYPPDDARTQPLTLEQLDRLTVEAAQAWLDKLIATSPIEVVVVGDLPRERATELIAHYLGALASRPRVSPSLYSDVRKLTRPAGPREITRALQTETPQAYVMSGFYGADEADVADMRALTVATRILSTRMVKEVREEAQLVYSISAGSRPGTAYPGFGWVSAASPTEPAKVPALVAKLAAMYAALAQDGVTADELDVAKKQMANTLDEQMREPSFWLGRIAQLTFRGASLDDVVDAPAAYQAMTADQVRAAFAKYYRPEQSVVVTVLPQEASTGAP
jgi:zinc protease